MDVRSAAMPFCKTEFWNWNQTWNTDNPDFSVCFEESVLAWIPCAWLVIFAPMDMYFCLGSRKSIPWSPLNVAKIGVTLLLILLQLILFGVRISDMDNQSTVELITPVIRIVTFALLLGLILLCKKRGIRSSGIQFLFWVLLTVCEGFAFRTAIVNDPSQGEVFVFILKMMFYPFIICQLFLNCWADVAPEYQEGPQLVQKPSPEEGASFLSKILFFWFETLAWQGYRKPLEYKDLWDLNHVDKSSALVPLFDKYWHRSLEKLKRKPEAEATFRKRSGSIDFKNPSNPSPGKKVEASILPTLIKVFGPTFFFGSFLKLINDMLTFVSPQILKLLISFVADKDNGKNDEWKGYFYAVLLLATSVLQTLILGQYFHRMFVVGMRTRTTLVSCIYRKALLLSNSARKESTVGEIVNLMSVDAQRFMDLTTYLNMIWSAPLQIGLSLYFLWDTLGPSVLAGLGVMILLIPINAVIASKVKTLQIKQMKSKDLRVKLMNEILSGIKVLKLYAWEPSFEAQIMKVRGKEIKVLKDAAYLNAASAFLWTCAPFLVAIVTFGTFVLSDSSNILDAEKAFVSLTLFNIMRMPMSMLPMIIVLGTQVALASFASFVLSDPANILDVKRAFFALSLFNILRFPLSMLPMMISSITLASVSLKRLNKFMNAEELDPNSVTHDSSAGDPIVIDKGTFSWDGATTVLTDINLRIKEGALVAIVGTVGSGKSSLLSAMLGEMEKHKGQVNTKGSIAYSSQQAWIQNCTLRDNILFGRPFEPSKYDRIIDCCALRPDLDILPAGDRTEIGEKGINLSGGQKQRVSLARSAYNNADIYLWDDPLSAVDSHTGKVIFLGPKGLLKKKTRVLVTHGVTFLPEVDQIIVVKDGEISESGSYQELLDKKGAFAEFLVQYLSSESNEDGEDQDAILQDLETRLDQKILPRQRSRISESDSTSSKAAFHRQISITSQESGEKESPRRRLSTSRSGEHSGKEASVANGGKSVKEKLIEVEKSETGSVKFPVYVHYLKAVGWNMTFIVLFLHCVFQGFSVVSNLWLSKWSNSNEGKTNSSSEADTAERDMYLGVYAGLGLGQAISVLVASAVMALGSLKASALLHYDMLYRVLRSPMYFFDSTPIGRILNRFAKDVDVCDNTLGQNIRSFLTCLFNQKRPYPTDEKITLVSLVGSMVLYSSAARAGAILHAAMLQNIFRSTMEFFDTTPLGRILNRFAKDIDVLDSTLGQLFRGWIQCLYSVLATLAVISYTTPIFMAVIFPIGILYFIVQRFYVATSRQLKRLESVSRSPIYSHFSETLTGSTTIRAYSKQDVFIQESESKVDHNQIAYYPSIISNRWLAIRLETVGNLIIFFAALFTVMQRESMDPGLAGLSISYALNITQTLNWLVRMTGDVETNIVAVERIKEYQCEIPREAEWEIPARKPPKTWPELGAVTFDKYQTRYREGLDLVLRDVTCKIHAAEKIGICGRTGAGKSSLTLGLFRIIEAAGGSISIDGQNISKLGLHDVRGRLTIIPQDPVLFSGTLRFNLDPFEHYSDDLVWRALELAHLKSFVKGLALGLQHEISEGGENLSLGQMQLLCLARALLKKQKILILDEATASVDLETDDLIQQTIRSEFRDCTVITIAHRLNTIMDSTRVIVLDKGEIREFDTPENLLKNKNSIFYGMAKDSNLIKS